MPLGDDALELARERQIAQAIEIELRRAAFGLERAGFAEVAHQALDRARARGEALARVHDEIGR